MVGALPGKDGVVLELGGGTGPVTRALLEGGVAAEDLIIIERDCHFHELLSKKFSDVTVLCGNAAHAFDLVSPFLEGRPVRAVVSSLPFVLFPALLQQQILEQALRLTKDRGVFIQFSYGLISPIKPSAQKELGLHVELATSVWRNLPPAKVWKCCMV